VNRSLKILVISLAASVALNVFFLGFWAARLLRHPLEPRDVAGRVVPDAEVRYPALRERWREHAALLGAHREAVRSARKAVRDALVADPFQPEALEAALTALRTETGDAQVAIDRALVDFARTLTPEERRALAESKWFAGSHGIRGSRE
jgi:uncharacterized membrane protein